MKYYKYYIQLVVFLLVALIVSPVNSNVEDKEVEDMYLSAFRCRHSEVAAGRVRCALELCGGDTNRFCRILKEIASEREDMASLSVYYVGVYGGTNELEYMYSHVSPTNANYDVQRSAMESIVRNGEPSERMVGAARQFICNADNPDLDDKNIVGEKLVRRFISHGDTNLLVEAKTVLEDFATQNYLRCYRADACLRYYFPDYSNSLQRLDYYRDSMRRGAYRGNDLMTNLMTNEIRRLEAVNQ